MSVASRLLCGAGVLVPARAASFVAAAFCGDMLTCAALALSCDPALQVCSPEQLWH